MRNARKIMERLNGTQPLIMNEFESEHKNGRNN